MNEFGYIDAENVFDPDYYKQVRLKAEEKAKLKRQQECKGLKYMVKCSCGCGRVLGSEVNYKRI